MKDEGFYNKAWKFIKKVLKHQRTRNLAWKVFVTALVVVIVFIVARYSQTAWYFLTAIWNEKSLIQSEQPLQLAIGLLTLLVTILVISIGLISWWTRKDWERFEKEQKPIIEDTIKKLEILQVKTEDLNWLEDLRESMKEDPHLKSPNALGTIQHIKEHYFKRDLYYEAWEYYGVARWFDKKEQYDRAIEYYEKANDVDLDKDNYDSNELRKHIWQSLGKNYFQRGIQLEDDGKNADAIKDYEAAIKNSSQVIAENPKFAEAHFNKASTLIQLGKIEGDKTEPYNNTNYCYKEAITTLEIIEDNYEHFYDKARAHALLNQRDEAIESLRHSFTLAERDSGKLLRYLERDKGDFRNVEEEEEFKALLKLY